MNDSDNSKYCIKKNLTSGARVSYYREFNYSTLDNVPNQVAVTEISFVSLFTWS